MELEHIPFGRYELLSQIGRGGMAEIFLALDKGIEGVEREVAIKRILPNMSESEDFVTMFMDEARVAAQLTHPNIAHIYNFGEVKGVYFLAMEYINGLTCSKLIRLTRPDTIPVEITLRVVADVCSALHFAHEMHDRQGDLLGLIHRDVNPQNVMVSHNGVAKLLDFGVARASTQSHATKVGQVKGKLGYIAPEAFKGQSLDRRADIFSTGAMLFEMLDGTKLFKREIEAATVAAILNDEPPPLAASRGIPAILDTIIKKAVAKEPSNRYATALDMQQDLEQLIARRGYVASPFVVGQFVAEMLERATRLRKPAKEEKLGLDNVKTVRAADAGSPLKEQPAAYRPPVPDAIPIDFEDGATEISDGSALSGIAGGEPSHDSSPSDISEVSQPNDTSHPSEVSDVSSPSLPEEISEPSIPSEPSYTSYPSEPSIENGSKAPSTPYFEDTIQMVAPPDEPPPPEMVPGPTVFQPMEMGPSDTNLIDLPEADHLGRRRTQRTVIALVIVVALLLSGVVGLVVAMAPEEVASSNVTPQGQDNARTRPLVDEPHRPPHQHSDDTTQGAEDAGTEDARSPQVEAGLTPPSEEDASPSKREKRVKASPPVKRPPKKGQDPPNPPGKLYLHTSPWSKVSVGSRRLGTTPIAGVLLPAGSHLLRLVDAEGRTHSRRIRIRPGESTKLFINMQDVGR